MRQRLQMWRAGFLLQAGRSDEALTALSQAEAQQVEELLRPQLFLLKARILAAVGDAGGALAACEALIRMGAAESICAQALKVAGDCLREQRQFREAALAYSGIWPFGARGEATGVQ